MAQEIKWTAGAVLQELKRAEHALDTFQTEIKHLERKLEKVEHMKSPDFITRYTEVQRAMEKTIHSWSLNSLQKDIQTSKKAVQSVIQQDKQLGGGK